MSRTRGAGVGQVLAAGEKKQWELWTAPHRGSRIYSSGVAQPAATQSLCRMHEVIQRHTQLIEEGPMRRRHTG